MRLEEQTQGAVTILKIVGPLTGDEARAFGTRINDIRQRTMGRYVLEATDLSFTDSIGLEILADASEQLVKCGRIFKICNANDTLKEVFDLTGLRDSFEHYDDLTAAVRSFL